MATLRVSVNGKDLPAKYGLARNDASDMPHQGVWRGLRSDPYRPRHAGILEVEARVRSVDSGIKLEPEPHIRPVDDPMWGRIGVHENGVSPQGSRRYDQTENRQSHADWMPRGTLVLQKYCKLAREGTFGCTL